MNIAKDEGFSILNHNPPGHKNVQLIIHIINSYNYNTGNTIYRKDNVEEFVAIAKNITDRIKNIFLDTDIVLKTSIYDDRNKTVKNSGMSQIIINDVDEMKKLEQVYMTERKTHKSLACVM